MKRPYTIYKKHKALQRAALNEAVKDAQKVCPGNCKYNQKVFFEERNVTIPMCSWGQFDQDDHLIDSSKLLICSSNKQARECNTFSPRLPDMEAVIEDIKMKSSTPESKKEHYPEIYTLDWVMDNEMHNIKEGDLGWFSKIILGTVNKLESLLRKLNKDKKYLIDNQKS